MSRSIARASTWPRCYCLAFALRRSLCSSKRRRLDSSSQSILWASHVSTPAALKRIMRPFCRCKRRRASAMYSSIRRRSSSKPIEAGAYVNAIRSSLDILALALVRRHNLPIPEDKVSFPFFRSEEAFRKQSASSRHRPQTPLLARCSNPADPSFDGGLAKTGRLHAARHRNHPSDHMPRIAKCWLK